MAFRAFLASTALILLIAGCSSTPPASTSQQSQPTAAPTAAPTSMPTAAPTAVPTTAPTAAPTAPAKPAALPALDEYSFDMTSVIADQTTQAKLAFKKGKMRLEATAMGQQVTFIADPDNKVAYMIAAGQNQALKMPYDRFQQQNSNTPDPRQLSTDASKGKLVGTETVDGQLCDVYESSSGTAGTSKVWVSKSNNFPLKAEVTTPQGVIKSEFKNVKTSGITDNLFELPAGVQVVDLSNMPNVPGVPGGVPGVPGGALPGVPTKP